MSSSPSSPSAVATVGAERPVRRAMSRMHPSGRWTGDWWTRSAAPARPMRARSSRVVSPTDRAAATALSATSRTPSRKNRSQAPKERIVPFALLGVSVRKKPFLTRGPGHGGGIAPMRCGWPDPGVLLRDRFPDRRYARRTHAGQLDPDAEIARDPPGRSKPAGTTPRSGFTRISDRPWQDGRSTARRFAPSGVRDSFEPPGSPARSSRQQAAAEPDESSAGRGV